MIRWRRGQRKNNDEDDDQKDEQESSSGNEEDGMWLLEYDETIGNFRTEKTFGSLDWTSKNTVEEIRQYEEKRTHCWMWR